jgi:hypothetical protein
LVCSTAESQDSSTGYKNCTARSMIDFPVRTFAPRITPSLPWINSIMIPRTHAPRFFCSDWIITTSPTEGIPRPPFFFAMYLSRRLRRYSVDHRFQTVSLHFCRYLYLFRKSLFSIRWWEGSKSWFARKNNKELGVITVDWTSSYSTYPRGRSFSVVSTLSKTASSSFQLNWPWPITL